MRTAIAVRPHIPPHRGVIVGARGNAPGETPPPTAEAPTGRNNIQLLLCLVGIIIAPGVLMMLMAATVPLLLGGPPALIALPIIVLIAASAAFMARRH